MVIQQILASQQIGFPILSSLVFLPLAAAAVLRFIDHEAAARRLALAVAFVELALTALLLGHFIPDVSDMQFVERHAWIATLGVGYHLGVDGISVLFLPLTALVMIMVMLAPGATAGRYFHSAYLSNLLALLGVTMGIFVALDMVLMYVFWELALVPIYLLIRQWGVGPQRQFASLKYIIYMLIGSAPLFAGIILLGQAHAEATGAYSFDLIDLMAAPVAQGGALVFWLLLIGFAVKGPLLPFHTWMPAALMQGPVSAGIFLVGLKLGVYGMLRFVLPLAPAASSDAYMVVVGLGLLTLVYAALIALVQVNLRRMLAFASISHVGLVLVGLFSLNVQSIQGALLMMLNMGLASTGLLFLAGALHARTGSTELGSLAGITKVAPKLAFFFFVFGMATIGLPGTSGFHGEFLTLLGAFQKHWEFAAIGVLGVILSAGYFLWTYERAFFGPITSRVVAAMPDLNRREFGVAAAVAALIIAIGLYPAPVTNVSGASIAALVQHIETSTKQVTAARAAAPVLAQAGR